jgi:hypothetical protein
MNTPTTESPMRMSESANAKFIMRPSSEATKITQRIISHALIFGRIRTLLSANIGKTTGTSRPLHCTIVLYNNTITYRATIPSGRSAAKWYR